MNAFDSSCDARNVYPYQILRADKASRSDTISDRNICPHDIEIDYKGQDSSVNNFLRLLYGQYDESVTENRRLRSHSLSTVIIFLSGHGGDGFFKFRDAEELSSEEIAAAIDHMHQQQRYQRLLLIVDTCQAASLAKHITAPNVVFIGSSLLGENSYSYLTNDELNVALIDRFSYSMHEILATAFKQRRDLKLDRFMALLDPKFLYSHPYLHITHHEHAKDSSAISLSSYFVPSDKPVASNHFQLLNEVAIDYSDLHVSLDIQHYEAIQANYSPQLIDLSESLSMDRSDGIPPVATWPYDHLVLVLMVVILALLVL